MDEWPKIAGAFFAALLVNLGVDFAGDRNDVPESKFQAVGIGNCEAINETKALARELLALSPTDPDITPAERQRFLEKANALTRPRNCNEIVR